MSDTIKRLPYQGLSSDTAVNQARVSAAIARSLQAGGEGGTFTVDGSEYSGSGYGVAVGTGASETIALADCSADRIGAFVSRYWDTATAVGIGAFGYWVHQGNVYLDVTEIDHSLPNAILKGIRRNQIAIWSFATNTEIATGGTGK